MIAGALGKRAGHYVFISTISVYADPPRPGITEDAPLRELSDPTTEVIDENTYGGLKALCEDAARADFANVSIVRPTYVVGPHDHTHRFTWWVARFARGGEILAPGPADDPMQIIDGRDLARFTINLAESRAAGVRHTMTPPPPFSIGELFEAIAAEVAPRDHAVTWVDASYLLEAGVEPGSFPLWGARDPQRFVLAADPSRAMTDGLAPRPIEESIRDTLEWAKTSPPAPGVGVTPEREAELLAAWRSR